MKATLPLSESQLQEAACHFLRSCCPEVLFWQIPNGQVFMGVIRKLVGRHKAETIFKRIMGYQYLQGFRSGAPDIQLMWAPRNMLFWELKTESGELSDNQETVHAAIAKCGHPVEIIRSLSDVQASIKRHGIPCRCQ